VRTIYQKYNKYAKSATIERRSQHPTLGLRGEKDFAIEWETSGSLGINREQ